MSRPSSGQKRDQKRKARRLAASEAMKKVAKEPTKRELVVSALKSPEGILFQTRTGYFSPRSGQQYGMSDLDVAEALDNPSHMVQACAKIGFAVLAGLFRYSNPAPGTKALADLAEHAAKWMKLDIEALRAELAQERADAAEAEAAKAQTAGTIISEPPVTQSDLAPSETSPA